VSHFSRLFAIKPIITDDAMTVPLLTRPVECRYKLINECGIVAVAMRLPKRQCCTIAAFYRATTVAFFSNRTTTKGGDGGLQSTSYWSFALPHKAI